MSEEPIEQDIVFGRHPVLALLEEGRPIRRLLLLRGGHGEIVDEIIRRARESGIPFDLLDRVALDRTAAGGNHQGTIALLAAREYADYDEILANAGANAFFLFLDNLQDPHNLGAILRSAHALGVEAAILPKRGSVGLTATVAKASAGAIDRLPVCRVGNLRRALDQARDAGFWITGLDPEGDRAFGELDFAGRGGLVIGAEGPGLRRLVREGCDFVARIPMGNTSAGSLNASVAAGIVLYEIFQQRHKTRSVDTPKSS
jgi:23S rRNA (guanosine2251-2'-O)-methyltransferase